MYGRVIVRHVLALWSKCKNVPCVLVGEVHLHYPNITKRNNKTIRRANVSNPSELTVGEISILGRVE